MLKLTIIFAVICMISADMMDWGEMPKSCPDYEAQDGADFKKVNIYIFIYRIKRIDRFLYIIK